MCPDSLTQFIQEQYQGCQGCWDKKTECQPIMCFGGCCHRARGKLRIERGTSVVRRALSHMTMLCWKPGWGTAWKQQHLCPERQEERTGLWKDMETSCMTSSLWVFFMCQVWEEVVRTENKSRGLKMRGRLRRWKSVV